MSPDEFGRWQAYLNIKESDLKKSRMKHRSRAASGGIKRGSKSR